MEKMDSVVVIKTNIEQYKKLLGEAESLTIQLEEKLKEINDFTVEVDIKDLIGE